jgi:hypothetical protein
MHYTKIFAIAGAALCLFVIFDNKPASPFHDAPLSLRLIGGAILAAVGGAFGGLIGLAIDSLNAKNSRSRISKRKCPFCAEDIQEAAIKCKHCGEMLDRTIQPPQKPRPTTALVRVASGEVTAVNIPNEIENKKENTRNTALGFLTLCIVFPIAMIIYSAVFGTSFAAMVVLLPIEGLVAWLTWLFLRNVLRCYSFWTLTLLSTGLGLAVGWYAAFRICSAALLNEVWKNFENTAGRSLTEAESSELYTHTLANAEFWSTIHQKASIPAIGVFLMILLTIVIMMPKPEASRT